MSGFIIRWSYDITTNHFVSVTNCSLSERHIFSAKTDGIFDRVLNNLPTTFNCNETSLNQLDTTKFDLVSSNPIVHNFYSPLSNSLVQVYPIFLNDFCDCDLNSGNRCYLLWRVWRSGNTFSPDRLTYKLIKLCVSSTLAQYIIFSRSFDVSFCVGCCKYNCLRDCFQHCKLQEILSVAETIFIDCQVCDDVILSNKFLDGHIALDTEIRASLLTKFMYWIICLESSEDCVYIYPNGFNEIRSAVRRFLEAVKESHLSFL